MSFIHVQIQITAKQTYTLLKEKKNLVHAHVFAQNEISIQFVIHENLRQHFYTNVAKRIQFKHSCCNMVWFPASVILTFDLYSL